MSELVTLDVLDRPSPGALRALRRLSALRHDRPAGARAVIPLGTSRFNARPIPVLTPLRVGVLCVWGSRTDGWEPTVGRIAAGAREHWHLEGEVVRTAFTEPWRGWDPAASDAAAMADSEPALILISGQLRPRYFPRFFIDGAGAAAQAFAHPGYLGGLGLSSAATNTTSCSAWRTYADARDYAFTAGAHSKAMKTDRMNGHHSTEWFTRIRPLHERGTLNGSAPFAGLLDHALA